MPGNNMLINNAINYYVSDNKIKSLITWLNENGLKLGDQFKNKCSPVVAYKR